VIYTSDHGDNLGARGLWGKTTMYEESAGVPMLVAAKACRLGSLVQPPAGAKTADICPKHGVSEAFYKWKAKYGGMDVSDARRLRTLEDENAKLKKLLAEAMLDNAMLRDVAARKW